MVSFQMPSEDDDEEPADNEPRGLNIKVAHDKLTGEWTATWGRKAEQTALSAATALRMLADVFEQEGRFGSADEQLANYEVKPDTLCKYCKAPIFFAIVPSGKFLAFDAKSVDPKDLVVDGADSPETRAAVFTSVRQMPRGPKPVVTWKYAASTKLPMFIPHPQTCGDSVESPANPVLIERWEKNRTVSRQKVSKAIDGLKSIRADMEQGIADDGQE